MSRKQVSKQEMLQLRSAFVIVYPSCFVPSGATKRPLKIGIKQDMLDRARKDFPGLTHRHIRSFLVDYTSGKHYFECCREGCARVDLDGTFSGFVTKEQAEFSAQCLDLIKQRKSPLRARFPRGPKPIVDLARKVISEALPTSYVEWAAAQHRASVVGNGLPVEAKRVSPSAGVMTHVLDAYGLIPEHIVRPPETLEERLARLESAQFASSMSNNFYHSDGSKARDDAEIAAVKRLIANQTIKVA